MKRTLIPLILLLLVCLFGASGFLHWTVNRVYVPRGYSLQLRYKGPLFYGSRKSPSDGGFADISKGEIGPIRQMVGPGRHFYCPIWWKRDLVPDKVVKPGEVAIATSKLGESLPQGQFLVDGDIDNTGYKGILRKVYAPGRYRVNPYAYDFEIITTETIRQGKQLKLAGWVDIPTGYVGVVTNLTDNPITGAVAGIQQHVLPPGLYPVNPKEQHIDVIEIGYRERSITVVKATDREGNPVLDEAGEPKVADVSSGINFPSNDGFPINMDFTAIWGIMPDQAAHVVDTFGNVEAVENKVIAPQIESICRNLGSKHGAVELLIGESRQKFQLETSAALRKVLSSKDITLLYGLVRHIYIPIAVRVPIQNANIADELKITRDQEQITAKKEAELREAERKVELESRRVEVDTEKLVAKLKAEGDKTAQETAAEALRLIAAIDKQTAELEAQATVLLGQARTGADKLQQEARAAKFALAVEAFGSGEAYNQWVFASNLPDDIRLKLLYAGEGTFWTDLKGFVPTMLGKQLQQQTKPKQAPIKRATNTRRTGR